jgi:hypothetical protein
MTSFHLPAQIEPKKESAGGMPVGMVLFLGEVVRDRKPVLGIIRCARDLRAGNCP